MRERLIDFLKKADEHSQRKCITNYEDAIADNADYLLAEGVIVPPVKVGQTVWVVSRDGKLTETTVEKIVLKNGGLYIKLWCNSFYETTCRSIGKTVFLTKEEAEKALAEMKGE